LLKNFFKKKISERDAVILFVNEVFEHVDESWESDKKAMSEYADVHEYRNSYTTFDIALATLSLELLALPNLLPQNKAKSIHHLILDMLRNNKYEGEYAYNKVVNEFLPVLYYSIEHQSNPLGDLAPVLWRSIIETPQMNSINATVLSTVVSVKLGKWKQITEIYKII